MQLGGGELGVLQALATAQEADQLVGLHPWTRGAAKREDSHNRTPNDQLAIDATSNRNNQRQ